MKSHYKKINTTCKECHSPQVYHDLMREETFCNHCGLIQQSNDLILISKVIQEEKQKEMGIRKLWHRKIHRRNIKQ